LEEEEEEEEDTLDWLERFRNDGIGWSRIGQIRKGRLWREKGGTFGSLQWRRRCYSIPPVLSYVELCMEDPIQCGLWRHLLFGVSLQGEATPHQWPGRTGCLWWRNRLSLRNHRWEFKTSAKLPIILEESIEYTPI
jgi:hypothetical protein